MKCILPMLIALALGACSKAVIPPSMLAPPPAELMIEPAALEPIPECEGEQRCRVRHYARSRQQYAETSERLRHLQRWVVAGAALP